jgi:dienelactone hydrolase
VLVASIERSFVSDEVQTRDVRFNGLVGKLFEPKVGGNHPAVLVVGGSSGGLYWSQQMAGLLASRGYVAFALAYFGMDGLPRTLNQIPLEYFGKALAWMSDQPRVIADKMGVVGYSRGGELALLLGASYPQIRTVVAYAPSGVLWGAYPSTGDAAWTRGGEDIPYVSSFTQEQWDEALAQGRVRPDTFDWYLIPLQDKALAEPATIAVEKINGPILLISGKDDKLWPSSDLAEIVVKRLRSIGLGNAVQHLAYVGAGHSFGWPHVPTTVTRYKHSVSGEDLDQGGSPRETAHARQDSWLRMLAFLEQGLSGRASSG